MLYFMTKVAKKMLKEAYFSLECHSVVVSLGTYTLKPDMDMALEDVHRRPGRHF